MIRCLSCNDLLNYDIQVLNDTNEYLYKYHCIGCNHEYYVDSHTHDEFKYHLVMTAEFMDIYPS